MAEPRPGAETPDAAARVAAPRRIRAPHENRGVVVDPPWSALPAIIDANRAQLERCDYDFQGRSLAVLRSLAQRELLDAARRYTATYRDVALDGRSERLFLAGHQPQLFHPGVWAKNFALGRLAAAHGATPINLVVDTDAPKSAALAVPTGTVERPHLSKVPFDRHRSGVPFERREIVDRDLFTSFDRRVVEQLHSLVPQPFVEQFWPRVIARADATGNLGAAFAQARHQVEGDWASATLELPQSRVCESEPFAWFAAHLLANLPRLWSTYNDVVVEYRRARRLRSVNHPVPNLAAADDWLEAPFWLWSADDPVRRRVFARQRGEELVISDRRGTEFALPVGPEDDASAAVDMLGQLGRRGICLRTRALMTTLFARLVVGDVFIHGIGGGKYDELTDRIAERFFGFELPRFAILSATLLLPIEQPEVHVEQWRAVLNDLRATQFHPERFVERDGAAARNPQAAELIAEKERWITGAGEPELARGRCHGIRSANEALQPFISHQRQALELRRETLARQLAAQRVLGRRDYSFCLYPEAEIRNFMLDFQA
ncbi:MAG TPA: hypothetical protein VG713_20600 [Pirellulales bacterium]|nr:hypothetical protein [Pirellulales bacterium]